MGRDSKAFPEQLLQRPRSRMAIEKAFAAGCLGSVHEKRYLPGRFVFLVE